MKEITNFAELELRAMVWLEAKAIPETVAAIEKRGNVAVPYADMVMEMTPAEYRVYKQTGKLL